MKYCNLNCNYLNTDIIERERFGDIIYEHRCMAQKGMPKVTIDTYCPYDEISETTQETNIEIKELKQELEVYKKALAESCWTLSLVRECFKGCPLDKLRREKGFEYCPACDNENLWQDFFLQKAREQE